MLRITVESSDPREPCVESVMRMLQYKRIHHKVKTARMLRVGEDTFVTIFERKREK